MGLIRNIRKGAAGVILAALVISGMTKPDKKDHAEKIAKDILSTVLEADIDKMDEISETVAPQLLKATEEIVSKTLTVSDKILFNVGTMNITKDEKVTTVGILRHVFIFKDKATGKIENELTELFNNVLK